MNVMPMMITANASTSTSTPTTRPLFGVTTTTGSTGNNNNKFSQDEMNYLFDTKQTSSDDDNNEGARYAKSYQREVQSLSRLESAYLRTLSGGRQQLVVPVHLTIVQQRTHKNDGYETEC
eukprot:CAMPEP_0119570950 /NCGR_PEP_ID=MMETSP1352-20130426/43873_1 /TAXON_ID=265584 /ORGANISM="Stauroneis constricta, Strain CCMP1120" /LENGTH=119 /DNA_ID=CAMNT_0007620627 /DNA_START=669 /DNA_END=1028 /DNA_ORIENTATION=+